MEEMGKAGFAEVLDEKIAGFDDIRLFIYIYIYRARQGHIASISYV